MSRVSARQGTKAKHRKHYQAITKGTIRRANALARRIKRREWVPAGSTEQPWGFGDQVEVADVYVAPEGTPLPEFLSEVAADAIIDLVELDAEMRGAVLSPLTDTVEIDVTDDAAVQLLRDIFEAQPEPDGHCHGVTTKKKPCKKPAPEGEIYCITHRPVIL